MKGRIGAEWSYESGQFVYRVTVPDGIKATFLGKTLVAGVNQFVIKEGENV